MADTRLPRNIFMAIVAIAVAMAVRDYPLIPDRVASHFSASGAANGWMSKPTYFAFYAALVGVAFAVEFLVPLSVAKTRAARMNLPNKEFWLGPARQEKTRAYLKRHFAWYGCAFLALEVSAMEMATRANMKAEPTLPITPVLFLLGAFLLYNVVWMARMFRRFSKTNVN